MDKILSWFNWSYSTAQPGFTCLTLTIETLEQGVKCAPAQTNNKNTNGYQGFP